MEFEAKVKQLEEIVNKLEDKNLGLEEGIDLYKEGLEITKQCLVELNGGKEKIKALQEEMTALFNGENNERKR